VRPEGLQPSEITKDLLLILGVTFLSQFAFSWKSKQIIHQRDNNQSVLSGETEDLECAHLDHSRENPLYDDPSNGRLLTTEEHLHDHINRSGRNGLSQTHNNWAIARLKERLGLE
jgi:hypothetical protein